MTVNNFITNKQKQLQLESDKKQEFKTVNEQLKEKNPLKIAFAKLNKKRQNKIEPTIVDYEIDKRGR